MYIYSSSRIDVCKRDLICMLVYAKETCIIACKCMYRRPTSSQIGVCQRNVYHFKATYITQKRPTSSQIGVCTRDLYHSKETYISLKRRISLKRDVYHSKETYIIQKRPTSSQIGVCTRDPRHLLHISVY